MSAAGGIVAGRPDSERLDAMLRVAGSAELIYDHSGSTLDPASGRPVHRQERVLGHGDRCFTAAVDGLRSWACHVGIGALVHPADAPIEVGVTELVVLPAGPVSIVVPNRIVAVVDELDRFGFAYGTLEGHQEAGEESFVVERRPDDSVVATIAVDARPATWLTRVGAPAAAVLQRRAIRGYLRGLQHHVEGRRR